MSKERAEDQMAESPSDVFEKKRHNRGGEQMSGGGVSRPKKISSYNFLFGRKKCLSLQNISVKERATIYWGSQIFGENLLLLIADTKKESISTRGT